MVNLFRSTVAYKILSGDKRNDKLSHAYAIVCNDDYALDIYLKIAAKILMCGSEEFCDECRTCRLVERETHPDVIYYPKEKGGKILTADIDNLISETFLKPIESDKRLFVLRKISTMNITAQNKLLKTLEEPQKNVFILIGIDNENGVLPTIKSRVKLLKTPQFSDDKLFEELIISYPDKEKLKMAISLADGSAGKAIEYYENDVGDSEALAYTILEKMRTSRETLTYSLKIDKGNIKEVLISLKKLLFEILRFGNVENVVNSGISDKISNASPILNGKNITENNKISELKKIYNNACCIAIIEKINQAERSLSFNGNVTMVAESVLLSIAEEKHRWQRL